MILGSNNYNDYTTIAVLSGINYENVSNQFKYTQNIYDNSQYMIIKMIITQIKSSKVDKVNILQLLVFGIDSKIQIYPPSSLNSTSKNILISGVY